MFLEKACKVNLPNAYTAAISAYPRVEKIKNGRPKDSDIYRDGYTIHERLKAHAMAAFGRIFRWRRFPKDQETHRF